MRNEQYMLSELQKDFDNLQNRLVDMEDYNEYETEKNHQDSRSMFRFAKCESDIFFCKVDGKKALKINISI